MKAAILDKGQIHVGDFPDPVPAQGQVLVKTCRCALCASDAHFLIAGETIVESSKKHGGAYAAVDLGRPIVMGHEFVGEILEYGKGSARPLPIGTKVTSVPIMRLKTGVGIIGYVNECPGGFGEYMLLDEAFLLDLPSDMDGDLAALTEPLAVGIEHARAGEMKANEIPLVLGCGAIGLGVIAGLKLKNIGPIVATDLDPGRRALALRMGADIVIDPTEVSPYLPHPDIGNRAPNVVYECIGKAGVMGRIIDDITDGGRIVMGGFCLEPEQIYVPTAQMKGLRVHFARGDTPDDMRAARDAILSGAVDMRPWLGKNIGLDGVGPALLRMNDPATAVRIVVDPSLPPDRARVWAPL